MASSVPTVTGPPSARVERVLASSRLLGRMPPALIAEMARTATTKSLVRGDLLWRAGDSATCFTLIQSGLVKVVRPLPDGTEAIVGIFGPRESVGDFAVVERKHFPAAAVVMSETADIVRVEAERILGVMQADASVALAMNRSLIEHTHALQEKIRVMSAGSVPKRLATLLLSLGERFGDELEGGEVSIPIVVSRGELACLIGARVETTIRIIRGWEKAGVLETNGSGFLIRNPKGLEEQTKSPDPS